MIEIDDPVNQWQVSLAESHSNNIENSQVTFLGLSMGAQFDFVSDQPQLYVQKANPFKKTEAKLLPQNSRKVPQKNLKIITEEERQKSSARKIQPGDSAFASARQFSKVDTPQFNQNIAHFTVMSVKSSVFGQQEDGFQSFDNVIMDNSHANSENLAFQVVDE